ncbi:hypothetical protein [uncultured Thiothrix sp.]|uniref:hypothetical protein n=1 Tax=uncultured Thiothrix sp. TaxID=223185 RepID=UPI0026369538|nr:hypothetical protein [uncultured Thiothrix sp.]HMT91860.1 hypothetical protein [Thiolinea sp.]
MKIKNRHVAMAILIAGIAAAGCSQQQAAPPVETVPEPIVEAPQPEPVPVIEEPAPIVQPAPPVQRPRPVHRPVQRPPVKVPPVKAKGNYRGAVPIDRRAMQQYQY